MSLDQNKVTEIIENTLKLLSLTNDQFSVTFPEEGAVLVQIQLPEDQTGLYIGNHGEGLASLQLVLALMLSQRTGEWLKLSVNINDYKERREESLCFLADNAAAKALELNQEIIIPNLSSYERRVIHLHLESKGEVISESRGEGKNRQLFIVPKTK